MQKEREKRPRSEVSRDLSLCLSVCECISIAYKRESQNVVQIMTRNCGGPLWNLFVFREKIFSRRTVAFLSVCFWAFFFGCTKASLGIHIMCTNIFLSFFSALSLNALFWWEEQKAEEQKSDQSNRARWAAQTKRTLSEEREKYTSDFDPFFFFSSFLGVAAEWTFFTFFFGLCVHTFFRKKDREHEKATREHEKRDASEERYKI